MFIYTITPSIILLFTIITFRNYFVGTFSQCLCRTRTTNQNLTQNEKAKTIHILKKSRFGL